jgi:hypothetical protein
VNGLVPLQLTCDKKILKLEQCWNSHNVTMVAKAIKEARQWLKQTALGPTMGLYCVLRPQEILAVELGVADILEDKECVSKLVRVSELMSKYV